MSYSPVLGRFIQRDPLGYVDGMDNYEYVESRPEDGIDPSGLDAVGDGYVPWFDVYNPLWNDGNRGDPNAPISTRGHSDFPGFGEFNYLKEDYGWTAPWYPWSIGRHFRPLDDTEADLVKDITNCDKDQFERHMHQMQDFFSHYGQGYRANGWAPIAGAFLLGVPGFASGALIYGHGTASVLNGRLGLPRPDNADDFRLAFDAASRRTQYWVDRWHRCCPKDKNGGCPSKDCSAPPLPNPWGTHAPPGHRYDLDGLPARTLTFESHPIDGPIYVRPY